MATAVQIKSLLQSHGSGDDERFYAVALQVAAAEARQGHQQLADEMRDLVKTSRKKADEARSHRTIVNVATPVGGTSELLDELPTDMKVGDLVLEPELSHRISRILLEQRNLSRIKENNLRPRQKLLFTGPPGCGKTLTASALACELGLPLFVVRLEALLSRYLGESLTKLRLIFDVVESTRAVYLFDEFDSIGHTRDAANEVGEIRRVLNSFLLFIERLHGNSLIIAATNHGERLDRALFRRFDDLVEFGLPKPDQVQATVKKLLRNVDKDRLAWTRIQHEAEGLSYAEITRACEESIKETLIHDLPKVTNNALVRALTERRVYLNH
jgi:SpoVK/Ycf46/Vps4 family AAA+-type ATPase